MNDISGIKQELDEITKVIANTVPVETIYLFGSYAYGTPNKDSDLDLFIIFKDEMSIRVIDAIHSINFAMASMKTKHIDFIGLKEDRFLYKKKYATIERKIAIKYAKIVQKFILKAIDKILRNENDIMDI
jgi:predicted nucleotidyltransferase